MTTKRMIVGILFLGLFAPTTTLTRAQDVEAPSPSDLLTDDYFGFDGDGDKTDCVSSCCSPCPTVYGYAEFLYLQRTNCSDDQPILVNLRGDDGSIVSPSDAATVLSTSDLDFGFDPAVRVLLGHRLHNGWAIEGGYFGFCDADTSAFVQAPNEEAIYTFPGSLGAVNVPADFDRVWTDYSSSVHSGELNLVCCCGCCSDPCGKGKGDGAKGGCGNLYCRTFEWFVGFRYLNLREHLQIYGERGQTTTTGNGLESSIYDIRTSNNLYGPQVGARVRRWGRKLGWEATGKAGIFGSDTQQEQYILDYPGFELRPLTSASDDGVAFVGELNLTGIYRLNETWNLRAGYNLMWITGVALAPDQLDFSGELPAGNQISSSGGVFLHGVSCGLEARW
jgi:hypothetical protein